MASPSPEGGANNDALIEKLVDEFRSRLDASLVLSIASDHDSVDAVFDQVREQLILLAENVPAEELTGFAQSGVASEPAQNIDSLQLGDDSNTNITDSSCFRDTVSPPTSLTPSVSCRSEGSDNSFVFDTSLWSDEDKAAELCVIFCDLKELDIKSALRHGNGDFGKAFDELLNVQYLEESGERKKGIDGFAQDDYTPARSSRKGKKKKKSRNTSNDPSQERIILSHRLTPLNLDQDNEEEKPVSYRLHSPVKSTQLTASPLPHKSRAGVSRAMHNPDPPLSVQTGWQTVESKQKRKHAAIGPKSAGSNASIRDDAHVSFAAASQAARRGRSDVLLRPYAGILAERGQDQVRQARTEERKHWQTLVHGQSSIDTIDLHGVPVLDGVRIALQRTAAWWDSFEEERVKMARLHPFTVVTGMGHHSANGISRMRQQVGAALTRHGWKTRTETGLFVVTGKI